MKPFHVYIIASARKTWAWSPQRKAAIEAASVGPDLVRCASCKKTQPKNVKRGGKKNYAVDHVVPVVPPELSFPQIPATATSMSWDDYLFNLFFGKLQILCLACHSLKSRGENNERRIKRPKKLPNLRTRNSGRNPPCNRSRPNAKPRNRRKVR